jgi:hypothetical protein
MSNRKYEVIALSVGGQNNKIFNCGDKVTDANFGKDRADELVKGGFLKPINSLDKAEDVIKEINEAESVEAVKEIVGDDVRKSIVKAADKRIADLDAEAQKLADEEAEKAEKAQKLVDSKLVEIAKCETVDEVEKLVSEDDNGVIKKAIEDKVADLKAAEQNK